MRPWAFADRLARSVRVKLLALVLAPLLLGVPLLLAWWSWGNEAYDRLMGFKIGSDLVTAHEYLSGSRAGRLRSLGAGQPRARQRARRHRPLNASRSGCNRWRSPTARFPAPARLRRPVARLRPLGQLRLPAEWPGMPAVAAAMTGAALTSVEVVDASTLEAIDPALRRRAYLPLVPTDMAAAPTRAASRIAA